MSGEADVARVGSAAARSLRVRRSRRRAVLELLGAGAATVAAILLLDQPIVMGATLVYIGLTGYRSFRAYWWPDAPHRLTRSEMVASVLAGERTRPSADEAAPESDADRIVRLQEDLDQVTSRPRFDTPTRRKAFRIVHRGLGAVLLLGAPLLAASGDVLEAAAALGFVGFVVGAEWLERRAEARRGEAARILRAALGDARSSRVVVSE